jgi:DNA repair protein RecO (recombination protein O)
VAARRGPTFRADGMVLRTVPVGESDLVVQLLTPDHGRLGAVARGARKGSRRFGGALEIATLLSAELRRRANSDLAVLTDCTIRATLRAARGDLDRIAHVSFALEIARLTAAEGQADPRGFALVRDYIAAVEATPASLDALLLWELAMLAHHGHALRLGRCLRTGGPPDALSLSAGGTIRRGLVADAIPVPPAALAALAELAAAPGAAQPISLELWAPLRDALDRLWSQVTGFELRSSRFLFPVGAS